MRSNGFSRRAILLGLSLPLPAGFAQSLSSSAAAQGAATTPDLVEAARKEGKLTWYAALDLPVAERVARAFEAKYPGVACRVERSGAERIFQRIGQEYASGIHNADVVESADASHFIAWKREGWLERYVPDAVAQYYPAEHKDRDGMYATWRVGFSVIAYNTNLVKAEQAPRSFADLLDPKWLGKIVKGHPSYSGTVLTATYQIGRDLGWTYFEKLAKQKVLQVQSANDSPKKVALGERAVMADGNEHAVIRQREDGQPIEAVYPEEGAPLIAGPMGVLKNAPSPNAARLFCAWAFSADGQQLLADVGAVHSVHPQVKEKPGRKPFGEINAMKEDPVAIDAQSEEIKARYTRIFGV